MKLRLSHPFARRGAGQAVSRAQREKPSSRDQGREMELTHKGLGHVRSGAPPTRGPRKAHPTQVLRLGFEAWVPRIQAAGIRPLPHPTPWGRSGRRKGILWGLPGLCRGGIRICGLVGLSNARRQQPCAESSQPICPITTPRKGQQVRDAPEPDKTLNWPIRIQGQ